TTYGAYTLSLRSSLERATGAPVQWVASNCGCNDPIELARKFQTRNCDYFEMSHTIAGWSIDAYSRNPVKRALRSDVRQASNHIRVARYLGRTQRADVIHLQQTLNAYGSDIASYFLRRKVIAARVITLHE